MLRVFKSIGWAVGAYGAGDLAIKLYTGTLNEFGIALVSVVLCMLAVICVANAASVAAYGRML